MRTRSTACRRADAVRRTWALLLAALLAGAAWSATRPPTPVLAAEFLGELQIVTPLPASGEPAAGGGSADPFTLTLPQQPTYCSGDSALAGYHVDSFMVPESVDPATLTWGSAGPVPVGFGADLRQPLWRAETGAPFVGEFTGEETPLGGAIGMFPNFTLAIFDPAMDALLPAGVYKIGIACTDTAGSLDRWWVTRIEIVADADDPLGFAWKTVQAASPAPTPTPSATPTPTASPVPGEAPTQIAPGAAAPGATPTEIAVPGATPTPAAGSVSNSASAPQPGGVTPMGAPTPGSGSSANSSSPGAQSSGSGGAANLRLADAASSSSSWRLVWWAVGLLAAGRIVMLVPRTPKLRPPKQ